MQQAYALIGEYQASLENRQEELLRDALSSVMSGSLTGSMEGVSEAFRVQLESLSEDYDRAKLEKNGAEMGRVLMEAKALAEAEYTNTEEYQMQVDAQEELIAGVQQAVGQLLRCGIRSCKGVVAGHDSRPKISGQCNRRIGHGSGRHRLHLDCTRRWQQGIPRFKREPD